MTAELWRFRNLRYSGPDRVEPLELDYEVNCSSMSDDYDPDETSAEELLAEYADYLARHDMPGPDISVYWSVLPVHETAPFQGGRFDHRNFLGFFSWPVNDATGEPLQWTRLPVADQGWRPAKGRRPKVWDKGGFIQQATGWKPAPLQRTVHLPSLLTAAGFGYMVRGSNSRVR